MKMYTTPVSHYTLQDVRTALRVLCEKVVGGRIEHHDGDLCIFVGSELHCCILTLLTHHLACISTGYWVATLKLFTHAVNVYNTTAIKQGLL